MSSTISRLFILALVVGGLAGAAWADVLEMQDGTVHTGIFVGGDESTISFQVGREVRQFSIEEIAAISFDSGGAAPQATGGQAAPTAASGAVGSVIRYLSGSSCRWDYVWVRLSSECSAVVRSIRSSDGRGTAKLTRKSASPAEPIDAPGGTAQSQRARKDGG